jgi:hypothetical protein
VTFTDSIYTKFDSICLQGLQYHSVKSPEGSFTVDYPYSKGSLTWSNSLRILPPSDNYLRYQFIGCVKSENKEKEKIESYIYGLFFRI